jgi:hypothetical protein
MARVSASCKWSNELACVGVAALHLLCVGAAVAQPLEFSMLSDTAAVARRLSQSSADERKWSQQFLQIARASEASGNWSGAAKAYGEAAIVVPDRDALRGLARATVMIPRRDAIDKREAKRRDFVSALGYLEVLRKMDGSPEAASGEDRANHDCIVAYLADHPPCRFLQEALAATGLRDPARR